LGPILFIIYIRPNDLVERVNYGSDLYLYADNAKLFSFIKTMEDSATLQKDLDRLTLATARRSALAGCSSAGAVQAGGDGSPLSGTASPVVPR